MTRLIGGCLKPLSGRGDPATGSANDALVACLVHHWAVPVTEPTVHIVSEQGAELGRPNTLYVEVDLSGREGQLAPGLKYTRNIRRVHFSFGANYGIIGPT